MRHYHYPDSGTKAAMEFYASMQQINDFYSFNLRLAFNFDNLSENMHNLILILGDEEKKAKERVDWETRVSAKQMYNKLYLGADLWSFRED